MITKINVDKLKKSILKNDIDLMWFFIGALIQYLNSNFFESVIPVWIIIIAAWLYGWYGNLKKINWRK